VPSTKTSLVQPDFNLVLNEEVVFDSEVAFSLKDSQKNKNRQGYSKS
jgi:hypothetical protein